MEYMLRSHEIFPEGGRKQLAVALWKNETNVLTMTYDVLLHTARLESNGIRRLFMVYQEGKRHPKTVFKNEYGFNVGLIDPLCQGSDLGSIELYEDRYHYKLNGIDNNIFSVYCDKDQNAVISFEAGAAVLGILVNKVSDHLLLDYFNCLLMSICWYLQLPAKTSDSLGAPLFVPDQFALRV